MHTHNVFIFTIYSSLYTHAYIRTHPLSDPFGLAWPFERPPSPGGHGRVAAAGVGHGRFLGLGRCFGHRPTIDSCLLLGWFFGGFWLWGNEKLFPSQEQQVKLAPHDPWSSMAVRQGLQRFPLPLASSN